MNRPAAGEQLHCIFIQADGSWKWSRLWSNWPLPEPSQRTRPCPPLLLDWRRDPDRPRVRPGHVICGQSQLATLCRDAMPAAAGGGRAATQGGSRAIRIRAGDDLERREQRLWRATGGLKTLADCWTLSGKSLDFLRLPFRSPRGAQWAATRSYRQRRAAVVNSAQMQAARRRREELRSEAGRGVRVTPSEGGDWSGTRRGSGQPAAPAQGGFVGDGDVDGADHLTARWAVGVAWVPTPRRAHEWMNSGNRYSKNRL